MGDWPLLQYMNTRLGSSGRSGVGMDGLVGTSSGGLVPIRTQVNIQIPITTFIRANQERLYKNLIKKMI